MEENTSTEEKIKEAARVVFTRKGFAATRTRDIAEEAGFNLALLNYYFRSKQKLFDIIMLENIQLFINSVLNIVNDPGIQFENKIEILISHYIDMLIKNPDLPMFVLSEVRANPQQFIAKVIGNNNIAKTPVIMMQWIEFTRTHKISNVNPIHFMMNLLSMIIFPFIASPILKSRTGMSAEQFNALMQERKKLIPLWINRMITDSTIQLNDF